MLMRALKRQRYAGRWIGVGEEFETKKEIHGRILEVAKKAVRIDIPAKPRRPPADAGGRAIEPPVPLVLPPDSGLTSAATSQPPGASPDEATLLASAIPEDWRDLPWVVSKEPGGLTLRGLAATFSESPIRSKDDAIAAIEAELTQRAGG